MTQPARNQYFEHLEAVTLEVRPILWYVADITGNAGLGRRTVSESSTVGTLLWDDRDGSVLSDLREKLGVSVEYADTLVGVARRFRAACPAKQ